ncbi:MAG: serine protease, partial [Spartobacteria bacterium]|nr:serine protease [Spartobacteria bacterium]
INTIMNRFVVALFLSCFTSALCASSETSEVTAGALVREMNLARQNPGVYAGYVEELRSHFVGNVLVLPGGTQIRTKEGMRAIDETVRFLRKSRPQPALELSPGMCRAAADHCADQSGGRRGHDGSDRSSPGSRISRYGEWAGAWGENIAYGKTNARDIILALIIDDGLPARKHRKNIFSPKFNYAGAAYGPHAVFRSVCSIDFAGGYTERGESSEPLVARNF